MGRMWRIECTAENTQTVDVGIDGNWVMSQVQTQSLGTKKWLSKRASGEPASSWRR